MNPEGWAYACLALLVVLLILAQIVAWCACALAGRIKRALGEDEG